MIHESREVLAAAALCVVLALALVAMAWRRLGVARLLLRTRGTSPSRRLPVGPCTVTGEIEPADALVLAPFTERPVVWVRARVRGVGPEGGAPRVLWEKVLAAPARVCDRGGGAHVTLELEGAQVLVPREYRHGALRALVPEVGILPRVLARVGYTSPPPSTQFFWLEEEVLVAGQKVTVVGEHALGAIKRGAGGLLVSNLNLSRIVLRVAWGPALALLLALVVMITGVSVVATSMWLR